MTSSQFSIFLGTRPLEVLKRPLVIRLSLNHIWLISIFPLKKLQCLAKYSGFLAIYKAKCGPFKLKYTTLKSIPGSWSSGSKEIWIRSFKWGTVKLSIMIYRKVMGHQSLGLTWSLPAKIATLKWGPGSIPSLGELWRLVTL